jgi:16S rRNA processing protein RimM
VGVVSGAHGVEGEMKVRLTTDDPEHLLTIKRIYVGDAQEAVRHRGLRLHQGTALLRLPGVTTPEQAKGMTGTPIRIAGGDARPLEPNEYYLYQVVGIVVRDEAGNRLGTVIDILETGANDVFVVRPEDGSADVLLPSIPDVVVDLRPEDGVMVVRPLTYWGE